jgi:hypothetical protein
VAPMDSEFNDQLAGGVRDLSRLQEEHRRYSQQLESLSSKPYLSEDEKLEAVRLKKLKLRIKDQMMALHRAPASAANVA